MSKPFAAAAALLAFAGCLAPGNHYPPAVQQIPVTAAATNEAPTPVAEPLPIGCSSLAVAPTGTLAKDVVGVWQDWGAAADGTIDDVASDRLTTFSADGRVTVSSFPLDAYGLADETRPAVVDFAGKYEVLSTGQLSIVWEDGVTELSSGPISVEHVPDCTMLVIAPEPRSRIPSFGQLERVVCVLPQDPSTGVVK